MIDLQNAEKEKKEFISKVIYPGNQVVKINSFKLQQSFSKNEDHKDDINLILEVESKPIEDENFEGFLLDKDNPEIGRHKGQVGSVKYSQWAFKNSKWDAETKQWIKQADDCSYRDGQIYSRGILPILKEAGLVQWTKDNPTFDTIQQLVDKLNTDKPFANCWFEMAIGAREYYSKDNYKRQDLFLLPTKKGEKNFKLEQNKLVELIKYNPNDPKHLVPANDAIVSSTSSVDAPEAPKAPIIIKDAPKEDDLPF